MKLKTLFEEEDLYEFEEVSEIARFFAAYLNENEMESTTNGFGVVFIDVPKLPEGSIGIQFNTGHDDYVSAYMFISWWHHEYGRRMIGVKGALPDIHDPDSFPKILEKVKNLDPVKEVKDYLAEETE